MVGVSDETPSTTSTLAVAPNGEQEAGSTADGDDGTTTDGGGDEGATADGATATGTTAGRGTGTGTTTDRQREADASTDGAAEAAASANGAAGTFEAGPSSLGRGLTLVAGLLASVSLAPALPAVAVGVLATVTLAYGLQARSGRVLGFGVATLVVALLLGGVLGTPAELLVIATGATILAWDVADSALVVGEQLGRKARTERLELVHAAASLAVAVVGSAVAYAVFRLAGGGRPLLAVVLLLLGATILVAVLR